MIQFKLKDRDITGARTGIVKSNPLTFNTPERACTSTELNYRTELNGVTHKIEYPQSIFVAQLRMDVKRFLKKDNSYFVSLKNQATKYMPSVKNKLSVLKPVLGLYVYQENKEGKKVQVFKTIDKLGKTWTPDEIQTIIQNITQLTDEAGEYDGMTLPYTSSLFKLRTFNSNLKYAKEYMEKEFNNSVSIIPELPHTDNVADFEKALDDYNDSHSEGLIGISYKDKGRYRYTHNAVRDFSRNDKSEKIGLVCLDAPRKYNKKVAYPHYALLEGYDFIVKKMTITPFIRKGGKGAHDITMDRFKQFYRDKLSIENFDKGLLFSEEDTDKRAYPFMKDQTYKELFRTAQKFKVVDTMLKVMESFDSHSEIEISKPYISGNDFRTYVKGKEALNVAYVTDFSKTQSHLRQF